MNEKQQEREKRYHEKFNNRLGFCFECCEAETLINDIKFFLQSEINLALAEREKEIVEKLNNSVKHIDHIELKTFLYTDQILSLLNPSVEGEVKK